MRRPKWLGGSRKPAPLHPELPAPTGPLREFVYLDEVSVISLVASRRGAVPEEVTRSESARESAELTGKIAANAAVVKSEARSKLAAEATKGVTTVAKSVVQATFKDLREIEEDRLRLKVAPDEPPPKVRSPDDLVRLAAQRKSSNWAVAASSLERGHPVELEVELAADPLFRVNTVIAEGADLIANMLDEAGMTGHQLAEMRRLSAVLDRLLAGLVPLRARVVDFGLVDVRGCELVVHRRLADALTLPTRDLTVVAVASRDLFWKDLRRVVFSGARYTIFSRVARTGIQRNWNPVKLAEAMGDIAPQMGDQLQELASVIQGGIRSGARGAIAAGSRESMMRQAVIDYAKRAAATRGASISEADLEDAGLLTDAQLTRNVNPDDWRETFGAVDTGLRDRLHLELSPERALELRTTALRDAGLLEGPTAGHPGFAGQLGQPDQWLLEVEPVAIYW